MFSAKKTTCLHAREKLVHFLKTAWKPTLPGNKLLDIILLDAEHDWELVIEDYYNARWREIDTVVLRTIAQRECGKWGQVVRLNGLV